MKELLLIPAIALALTAQTPAFEVASIKPNHTGGGISSIRVTAGRVTMENVSLKKVTLWAYGIPDDREYALVGADWLTSEHFDFQASFPVDTPPEQIRAMTQALLAEWFKLALHKETRQLPLYVLVVAKNGPKINAVEDGQPRTSGKPGRIEATKISMNHLADLLARAMRQQVVNETGLQGVFDFTQEWAPDEMQVVHRSPGTTGAQAGRQEGTGRAPGGGSRGESSDGKLNTASLTRAARFRAATVMERMHL
jgi:uncharacterized protein (TIGR03435 family)